jgi:hypothetical protein
MEEVGGAIGLCKKSTTSAGELLQLRVLSPGHDDDANQGALCSDVLRHIHAVARAGHFDVRDHSLNVWPRLQESDCLVSIGGFHDPEASIIQNIGIEHPNQDLILDEQEHRASICDGTGQGPSPSSNWRAAIFTLT